MAGCEVNFQGPSGDKNAGEGRVLGWVLGGATLGGVVAYLNAAGIAGFAAGGAVGLLGLAIVVLGAAAGAIIGFAVNWFDRLYPQNPSTITLSGCVLCAGKNTGFPPGTIMIGPSISVAHQWRC